MKDFFYIIILFPTILSAQKITAHRGASHDAPENTMAAFNLAWQQKSDFVEGDFYLTKDGQVVCFHDGNTGKIADQKLSVEKSTWQTLKQLDVGSKKGKKWQGTRMPLLDDLLKSLPPDKGVFIEIKSANLKIVPRIKSIIDASKVDRDKLHIISFKQAILKKCKEIMPDIKAQWLVSLKLKNGKLNYDTDKIIQVLKSLKIEGVGTNCNFAVINKSNVTKLQSAGFYWNVWTINKVNDAISLKKIGVDFITTDRPLYIRQNSLENQLIPKK